MKAALLIRGLAASASMVALGLTTALTATATTPNAADKIVAVEPSSALPAEALEAMQRDLGLSKEQAENQARQATKATQLNAELTPRLGSDFAGSWFDAKSGKLVVAVTSAQRAAQAQAAGAKAKVVAHSQAKLDGIKAELDTLAEKDHAATAGLASWRVDPQGNSVVVTVLKGQSKAKALTTLSRHGNAVRVEETNQAPTTTALMRGGDAITTSGLGCSAGFNAYAGNTRYLFTAGHCYKLGNGTTTVTGQGGVFFGNTIFFRFPNPGGTWKDDALVRNDNPGAWTQGPWINAYVAANPNATYIVRGHKDSPVGTPVCKSGRTTKLTCGYITVKNETVTYTGNYTVTGLTRHSACVEPGDSGGSNFSWDAQNRIFAEGITSGAQLNGGQCLSKFGQQNVSWYQPIANTLPAYAGAVPGLTLWIQP